MTEQRESYNKLPWGTTVNGNPIPKGRPRVYNGHATTPKRTREYEALVRDAAAICWQGDPTTAQVRVELRFWRGDKRKVDLDNLVKAVLDALNGVVWEDDEQIIQLTAYKNYNKSRPRVDIQVDRA